MKALIYSGPDQLRYEDVPDPVAGSGETLVRIEATGICGSDLHAYLGRDDRRPAPLILGHEAAGTIASGKKRGTRVAINPLVTCGACPACLSGGTNLCAERQILSLPPRAGTFAQLAAVPKDNLITIPDHVTLTQAALIEPIACGWHAARLSRRAFPRGRTVLVIGGGAIGLCTALSLTAQGIDDVQIYEPNSLRATYLDEVCGQNVVSQADLPTIPAFDIVIDAVGSATSRAMASAQIKAGGVIGHIGLAEAMDGLDIRRMTLHEITFIGTYTYTAQDFRDASAAIFDGRLGALDWAQERPLSDGAQAFADLCAGQVGPPKIILRPQDG